MQLGERLQAVANFVEDAKCVADIGTDHAYLAVALVKAGRAARAVAADLNEGPLRAAKHTVRMEGLSTKIDLRLTNGLAGFVSGEVDVICIAGMGGNLMAEILEAAPEVLGGAKVLVLQPMNAAAQLRAWLIAQDWTIEKEALAKEDGRLYEIIKAVHGHCAPYREEELYLIGARLWEEQPPLLKEHLEHLIEKREEILQQMSASAVAKQSEKYQQVEACLAALKKRKEKLL